MLQDNMTNYHLSFIAKTSRPTQLLAGPKATAKNAVFCCCFWHPADSAPLENLRHSKNRSCSQCYPIDCFSLHTLHMSKPATTFVFKLLLNRLPRDILYTYPNL